MILLKNESVKIMNEFDKKNRSAVMNLLMHRYSIPEFDADDILQDAWVFLMDKLMVGEIPNVPEKLLAYMSRVCSLKAHEYLRKKAKVLEIEESFDDDALTTEKRASVEMEVQSWADHFEMCERTDQRRIDAMNEALGQLNQRQRDLLHGYYHDNCSMKDLAKRLGYSNERVAITTKNRIIKSLRNGIQQQERAHSNGLSPVAFLKVCYFSTLKFGLYY